MKKDLAIIAGLFLVIIALLVFGQGYTSLGFMSNQGTASAAVGGGPSRIKITDKTLTIDAEVAATSNLRKKGLSKRDELPFDKGMIFVFDNTGQYGIWMKDMRFAIDIIWIDADKKIVDIVENVPPEPGKADNKLTVYKPRGDAKYVLEINAGLASANGLQIGDPLNF
ncbi:DUF192 domain-containing protein [Candidatus Curtissbacteria bacterium]|nr:DUF192 domain-containing protein [Candidatus Curtissbacteria bacterium]